MAAEVFTPNSIIASVPWDGGGWNAHPGHVAAPQAQRMTLLKLEKMRTLMLHNVLGHSNKSRSREGIVPYDSTPDNVDSGNDVSGFPFILPSPILRATRPAADQVEVERLVALDVEELVRHTSRRRKIDSSQESGVASTAPEARRAECFSTVTVDRTGSNRKRRRSSRSGSPSCGTSTKNPRRPRSRHAHQCGRDAALKALPLRLGLPASDLQRLEAALHLAKMEAHSLRTNLNRVLGSVAAGVTLPEEDARAAIAFVLAEPEGRGDVDVDSAILKATLGTDNAQPAATRDLRCSSKRTSQIQKENTRKDDSAVIDEAGCDGNDKENVSHAGLCGTTEHDAKLEDSRKPQDPPTSPLPVEGHGSSARPSSPSEKEVDGNHEDIVGSSDSSKKIISIGPDPQKRHHERDSDKIIDRREDERMDDSGTCEAVVAAMVDRARLISTLTAEKRLCAMASHLGSAEPIRASWVRPSATSNDARLAQPEVCSPSVRRALAKRRIMTTTSYNQSITSVKNDQRCGGNSTSYIHQRRVRTIHRSDSAGDTLADSCTSPALVVEDRGELTRRKRRRGTTKDGRALDNSLGCTSFERQFDEQKAKVFKARPRTVSARPPINSAVMLRRSKSFAMGEQRWKSEARKAREHGREAVPRPEMDDNDVHQTFSVRGVESELLSLPTLKLPRLGSSNAGIGDKFDRFGGRETPHVLRRGSLTGGGENSQEAINELRRQLEISEGGLVDLKARVRADVAWVQETVGRRMSRQARLSCCRWGSEKVSELTHRWEGRSVDRAMAAWVRHRDYMANKEFVRAFLRRRAAAQVRRLLKMWGRRLVSRALGEWRRTTRIQRRAEETAAASATQRIALGFLARRRVHHILEGRGAIQIQKTIRAWAGRRRVMSAKNLIRRHQAAGKIQDQTRKKQERLRAQRIVALKKRRRAARKIQRCGRGFLGRRTARMMKEHMRQERRSTSIQVAWRGLQGRRKGAARRKEVEEARTIERAAAIHIQSVQRRHAAKGVVENRRMVQAFQRRKSAELAVVSLQKMMRGKVARNAVSRKVAAKNAAKTQREEAAAAVHIQRVARGRKARMMAATHSHALAATTRAKIDEGDDRRVEVTSSEEGGYSAKDHPEKGDGGDSTEGVREDMSGVQEADKSTGQTLPQEMDVSTGDPMDARNGAATQIQALTRGRVARAETGRRKYERVKEEKRREVVWDQNTITADTSSRLIEVQHQQPPGARQYDDESIASAAKPRAADGDDAEEGGQVVVESPGADETSFPPSKPQQQPNYDAIPEAATTIQAAFRGGHARRDATKRRSARTANEAERNARALKKREGAAAIKIQTQARGMAAKQERSRHRARHTARVGSIRESGRAAADDVRALSRPGTAASAAVITASVDTIRSNPTAAVNIVSSGGKRVSSGRSASMPFADHQFSMATEADCHAPVKEATVAGEEGENRGPGADVDGSGHKDGNVSGNDDDDDKSSDTATSPSRSPSTTECRGGNVLTPSSDLAKSGSVVITQDNEAVARGRSATNALHDVACADDSGVDHEGPLSRRTSRAPSSKRKPSSPMIHARTKGRSRSNVGLFSGKSPSRIRPRPSKSGSPLRSSLHHERRSLVPGADNVATSARRGDGRGVHESRGKVDGERGLEDIERMQKDIRQNVEAELQKELASKISAELAAKMAEQEADRESMLKSAEEARRRDKEAVEEEMRRVFEAHTKDAEEIALIKAKMVEAEAARRAEHDAGRQEYERRLKELREEALAEAEKSRVAALEVTALRQQMEEEGQHRRRHQEQAEKALAARETTMEEEGYRKAGPDATATETTEQGDMTSAGIEMGNGGDNPLRTVARDGGSREECDAISNVAQRKQHMPQPKEHQSEGNNKPFEQQNEHPRQMEGQAVVQQLAVEAAEKQRIELAQLQVQLRNEEEKRLEAHAAWEARQVEGEAQAKEERRAELEAIEGMKRQLEEETIQANRERELLSAELRMQMDNLRTLQEKAEEQERIRKETERVAAAVDKARQHAVIRAGARLMQDNGIDDEDDEDADNHDGRNGRRSSPSIGVSSDPAVSIATDGESAVVKSLVRSKSGAKDDVEEEHADTGSRLAQVEGALLELSKKQADLETREKEFDEARKALTTPPHAHNTRVVRQGDDRAGAALVDSLVLTVASPTKPGSDCGDGGGGGGQSEASGVPISSAANTPAASLSTIASDVSLVDSGGGMANTSGGGVIASSQNVRAEWVEYWDESAGASYYYNTVTQEASWTNPYEPTAGGGVVVAGSGGSGEASSEGATAGGPEAVSKPEDGRAKWVEALDEASGATYYYNVVTGEAVWEKPTELSQTAQTVDGVPQFDNPEEWVCFLDENSGEEYWFNLTTGETHWGATSANNSTS